MFQKDINNNNKIKYYKPKLFNSNFPSCYRKKLFMYWISMKYDKN